MAPGPNGASAMIARQIERLEAGHKLEHVVEASGAIEL